MTRLVEFQGKIFSFPDDATDEKVSDALSQIIEKTKNIDGSTKGFKPLISDFTNQLFPKEDTPFYKEGSFITGGIILLIVLTAFFIFRKLPPEKLEILYSLFRKTLILALVLFGLWMFRYEVTNTHPHQCLDRWIGEVVYC